MTVDEARAKARETAERIKKQSAEEKHIVVKETAHALADLNVSAEVLAYFNETADTGIQDMDLNNALPILRMHTGTSTKNELLDGSTPKIGQLYYTGSRTAYDSVHAHIVVVRKCKLPDLNDSSILKSHYLVAGVLDETNEPFVMYVKGLSYNKVWELQEQIQEYVKSRGQKIPMYALKIMIYTDKEQPQDKKKPPTPVYKFELLKNPETGFPLIETNFDRIRMLKIGADKANEALQDIIDSKGVAVEETVHQQYEAVAHPEEVTDIEDVADDVPF